MSVCSICTNNGLAILAAFSVQLKTRQLQIAVLWFCTIEQSTVLLAIPRKMKRLGRVVSKEGIADLLKSLNNIRHPG